MRPIHFVAALLLLVMPAGVSQAASRQAKVVFCLSGQLGNATCSEVFPRHSWVERADAWYRRAKAQQALGNKGGARASFMRAIRLNPDLLFDGPR